MYYVLQSNTFREHHHQLFIDTVARFGFDYEIVDVVPFTTDFEFKTDRKDVICFGSVTMAHIAKKYGWNPGSFYNENHDFEIYGPRYGEHCLNADAEIIRFGDPLPDRFGYFFARPTKDSKVFTGRLFSRNTWQESVDHAMANGHSTIRYDAGKVLESRALDLDTKVMLCKFKVIYNETRTWILDGKVVTSSQYKIGDKVIYNNVVDDDAVEFAQEMAEIYQPAKGFVLDVCRTDEGMKIVEINCLNCSGFYHADLQKLLYALDNANY